MRRENNCYGLVVCGGKSERMGIDKSEISYYGKPQKYHAYSMLESICGETFISCNCSQVNRIDPRYQTLVDLPAYSSIGPMAAVLTAFAQFPQNDFFVMGCDYPLLTVDHLKNFAFSLDYSAEAAAFYNAHQGMYDPLLAWYSHHCSGTLSKMFNKKEYSLQHFLHIAGAKKYYPSDVRCMRSIDTREGVVEIKSSLRKRNSNRSNQWTAS